MHPPMGPPPGAALDKLKEPKPRSIKEVPAYLKNVIFKFFSRLLYIFRLVWETKPLILIGMLCLSIFSGLLPVGQSYAGSFLLNSLAASFTEANAGGELSDERWMSVIGLLVLQFVFIFAISLTNNINSLVTRISGELVANHVRVKIMEKAKNLDIESFDKPDFYARLENAAREADHRPIQIINSVFTVISTVITIISYFAVLISVKPVWASLLVIALSIPGAIVSFVYKKKNFRYMRHRSKDRRMLSYFSNIVTDKDLAKEIRIFGLSDLFTKRYREVFIRYFNGLKALFLKEGAWNISLSLVSSAANCILFIIIARKVFEGSIEIGNYSLYTGALNSVAAGIATFISTTATVYEGTLFIDNLITFMNEKVKIQKKQKNALLPERHKGHEIEFRNVSFRYPGLKRNVINNVSFRIKPGDTVVLVGLNGAGKTTLIKLLTRLYDPTEGTILLDGKDIKEYDVESLYDIYGIIFQDFGKYAVSVKENIAFGQADKNADENRIRLAAEKSDSAGFIDRLPDKYDTPLMRFFEENGTELSIGQWQKLSIARAFYSDSDILILDEPTASLDAIAEQEIYNRFDELRKDRTTVFVSHRLSSATVADKILVLENGCLIEEGNHKELMELKGRYHELFSTQAKRYIET
ncbi:MAG: ABC transporter ATP-binding protein [Clostridia bacterium]|nr:ABC transporter ATP-binding protein [Clostridia bacterium]